MGPWTSPTRGSGRPDPVRPSRRPQMPDAPPRRHPLRAVLVLVAFLVALAVVWEGFKWLFGDPWRLTGILGTSLDYSHVPPFHLVQARDTQLPHLWDIVDRLGRPFARNADVSLAGYLVEAALYTLREAIIGFGIGTAIGITLASIFVHSSLAERALLPWVIASQTLPI